MSHKILIENAFAKAEQLITKQNGTDPSKTRCAEYLEEYLADNGYQFNKRSLLNRFNEAVTGEEVTIRQQEVVQLLSKFLGYDSYVEFANSLKGNSAHLGAAAAQSAGRNDEEMHTGNSGGSGIFRNYKTMLVAAILGGALAIGAYHVANEDDLQWMKWQEDHFEETEFDRQGLKDNKFELLVEDRLKNFKQVEMTCDSVFFTQNGVPRVWYRKVDDNGIEFFTSAGRHPVTGIYVKPITQYMIDKYVCVDGDRRWID